MTADELRQRIAELEAAQKEAEANYHRLAGAIAMLRELLAKLEAQEPKAENE